MKLVLGFILNPRNFEIMQRNIWASPAQGKEEEKQILKFKKILKYVKMKEEIKVELKYKSR